MNNLSNLRNYLYDANPVRYLQGSDEITVGPFPYEIYADPNMPYIPGYATNGIIEFLGNENRTKFWHSREAAKKNANYPFMRNFHLKNEKMTQYNPTATEKNLAIGLPLGLLAYGGYKAFNHFRNKVTKNKVNKNKVNKRIK